ncbi:MAG: D-alanyl-D-alanine carboxypeptidase [Pseudomonadales bacterium]|nr:D-alanyl-D-alanine carboxypeptidase [Pseudomonadales bacterium]
MIPRPPSLDSSSYIMMDATTARVLVEFNSDEAKPPASLTKIMSSYVGAAELDAGRVSKDELVPVSVNAWKTPGSKMFIKEGTEVMFQDLVMGMVVQSGNDASVALAEHVAGSEPAFAEMMNQYTLSLGMTNSYFLNSTGLPDDGHVSTARDMAILSISLIRDFPDHYALYKQTEFTFNDIHQPNRNRLLFLDKSVDGIKTGYTDAAGFCLAASAERSGMRLVTVVLGADSEESRIRDTKKLLSYGFRTFETREVYDGSEVVSTARVSFGTENEVWLVIGTPLTGTYWRGRANQLEAEVETAEETMAPISQGQELGTLRLKIEDEVFATVRVIAEWEVEESGFFSRSLESIGRWFGSLFE